MGGPKFILLFITIFLFSLSCMQTKEPKAQSAEELKPALDFMLQDLNQRTFSLSSYKDKHPVILFFWTTWCPFCQSELSSLRAKYPRLSEEGWELFAVNVAESAGRVAGFLRNYYLGFNVLLDKNAAVARAYDVLGVPTYIIIDKKGSIRFSGHSFPEKYEDLASE